MFCIRQQFPVRRLSIYPRSYGCRMTPKEQDERQRVLDVATSWRGTPFHDNARLRGIGCDCAQLLAAVFEEAGVMSRIDTEFYHPTFFMHRDEERFLSYVLPRAFEIQ